MKASSNSHRVMFILFLLGALFADGHSFSWAATENVPVLKGSAIRDPFLPLYPKREAENKAASGKAASVTRSAASTGKKPPEFTLQGLVWGQTVPQAIINNRVVNIGDTIDEAKVIDISKEGVRLLYQNDIILIKPQITAGGKK